MGITNKCIDCGQRIDEDMDAHFRYACPARRQAVAQKKAVAAEGLQKTIDRYGHTNQAQNDWADRLGKPQAMNHDLGKLRYILVPARVSRTLAEIFGAGARKYAVDDWRKLTVANRIDAAYRHIMAFREGQRIDPQDAFHHLAMAAADLLMASEIDLDATGKDVP